MREMKNSEVRWLGMIPKAWDLDKIVSLYSERSTKVSDRDYPALSVTKQGIVPQLESAAKTDNGDNRKLIKKNDFVINSRSDRRGSCGISEYEGSCSLINTVLAPKNNMVNQYYNYLFKTELFADEFYKWGNGIVDDLWSTKWSSMKNIMVPFPPLKEQRIIADYLDIKCSQIDTIIAKEQSVIEKMQEYKQAIITQAITKGLNSSAKMKETGFEWIGMVPEHWDVKKIKYLTSKIGSGKTPKGGSDVYIDEGVLFIRSQNVYDGYFDLSSVAFISHEIDSAMSNTRVYRNDVLLNITGGSIGRSCLYESDELANVNQHVCIIRCNNQMRPKFMQYFWNSRIGKISIDIYQSGANREGLNFTEIGNTLVPTPELHEQDQIIDYLDGKCGVINDVIQQKYSLINKLTEYKKSLIYEVVTGKKEVHHV
jgi:type I restriction modification DNA specificity domain protein